MSKLTSSPSLFLDFGGDGGGGGGGSTVIIDNLTSTSTTAALSANMGRELRVRLEAHEAKIASTSELGHVKVDGTTITVSADGTISAIGGGSSSSIKKEEVIVQPTSDQSVFTFTPQIVDTPFIELIFINTTKLKPDMYTRVDNSDGSTTITLVNPVKAPSGLFNATLISGMGGSGTGQGTVISVNQILPDNKGNVQIPMATVNDWGLTQLHDTVDNTTDKALTPNAVKNYLDSQSGNLKKEEIVYKPATLTRSFTFTPSIVSTPFIEIVFVNTTKLDPANYTISDNGDGSFTIELAQSVTNTGLVNFTLISGWALGGTGGSGTVTSVNGYQPDANGNVQVLEATTTREGVTTLHDVIDTTDDKAVTPNAVKEYIDNLDSTLTDDQRIYTLNSGQNTIPIENPNFDPSKYVLLLFRNSTKVPKRDYTINTSTTSPSGYEITLSSSVTSTALFEIVLIYGRATGSGGDVDDYIYEGSTPPSNTSLIWFKK